MQDVVQKVHSPKTLTESPLWGVQEVCPQDGPPLSYVKQAKRKCLYTFCEIIRFMWTLRTFSSFFEVFNTQLWEIFWVRVRININQFVKKKIFFQRISLIQLF